MRKVRNIKKKLLKLSLMDIGTIACNKSLLIKKNRNLYAKMKIAIDAFEQTQYKIYEMTSEEKQLLFDGGALMYHLMTDSEFLKDVKLKL